MHTMLRRLARAVVQFVPVGAADVGASARLADASHLTLREQQVLRLIAAGKTSREGLEGLRGSHVRKPQRKLPKHIVELFAADRRVGKSLAHGCGKARRTDAEGSRARSIVLSSSSGNSSRSVILWGRNVIGISRH